MYRTGDQAMSKQAKTCKKMTKAEQKAKHVASFCVYIDDLFKAVLPAVATGDDKTVRLAFREYYNTHPRIPERFALDLRNSLLAIAADPEQVEMLNQYYSKRPLKH
jgi:hypothetical protein